MEGGKELGQNVQVSKEVGVLYPVNRYGYKYQGDGRMYKSLLIMACLSEWGDRSIFQKDVEI